MFLQRILIPRFNSLVKQLFAFAQCLATALFFEFTPVTPANQSPGCVPPPPGLVAWWKGDGTADDVLGRNNGTLMNGASFAEGMVGQGFSLDGIDDFVLVPNSPSLSLTNELS